MIFRGCGCMWNCVMPIGMQLASGLSFISVDIRCFFTPAAHGVSGRPPGTFVAMSQKAAIGGAFGIRRETGTRGSPTTSPPASRFACEKRPASSEGNGSRSARSQLPERSGLPSAVRGGGASMRTRPCASRGTPSS